MLSDRELQTVRSTFLFRDADKDVPEALFSGLDIRRTVFPKGKVVYTPETFSRQLGILLSGRMLVTKGALTVSELAEGDVFGAAALYGGGTRYAATLTARTECVVLFLTEEAVRTLIDRSPVIRENYIRYLTGRILFLSAKVDALSAGSGGDRLARYLLSNADDDGILTVRSMTELASRLGMGRASLYRELDKLTARGAITRRGKTVILSDPALLESSQP